MCNLSLADREADKYRRMWAVDTYGDGSPGVRIADRALEWFHANHCRTLMDYGCGDGQALRMFRDSGVDAYGCDIAPPVDDPRIVTACLWALPPKFRTTDFAFSADVLEHLPPEKVGDALAAIREHTTTAGMFSVFTRPDSSGAAIGETLHLTVEPEPWWTDAIGEAFEVASIESHGSRVLYWVLA